MNKKKVVIISPTGMLGSMVYNVLKEKYNLVLVYRNKEHLKRLDKVYGDVEKHISIQFDITNMYYEYEKSFPTEHTSSMLGQLVSKVGNAEAIINCAGIIKPFSAKNPSLTFFINSAFPHFLANIYKEKLIHITTDCVFSGIEGAPYDEQSPHSPNDLYGLSKELGEPFTQSLVLRTSIIGPEIHGFVSLISWLQRQKREVAGFTNLYWNGITTKQFAVICDEIISNRKKYPKDGLFHIFSSDVTKYEMLVKLQEKYKLQVLIKPVKVEKIDRRLRTIYDLNKSFEIPNFEDMIKIL